MRKAYGQGDQCMSRQTWWYKTFLTVHMHRQYIKIVEVYSSRVSWTVTIKLELQIQKCSSTVNTELHGLNSTCLKIDIIKIKS